MNFRLQVEIENASVEELKAFASAPFDVLGGLGRGGAGGRSPPDGGGGGPNAIPPHLAPDLELMPPAGAPVPAAGPGRSPLPAVLENPLIATLPPEQDVLATAQAMVNGQITGTLSPGGPGSLNQPPRRRPDPQRVQLIAGWLLDQHLGGQVQLGNLLEVGAIEQLAEQVLAYLDAGGRPPALQAVVRQSDAAVPDVVRGMLDAELLAIAHHHVAEAAAGPALAGPVAAPENAAAENVVPDSVPPAAAPAAPDDAQSTAPSVAAPESPAEGIPPHPAHLEAAPTTPPIVLAQRPIADVERAMRLVLPHVANLVHPVGGLVNYAAGIIARAGLPSHVAGALTSTGDRPLVHLARLAASTLVGLCATRHIGLQTYMERDYYSAGADQATLPKPGMLGIDDGGRGNPLMDLNRSARR